MFRTNLTVVTKKGFFKIYNLNGHKNNVYSEKISLSVLITLLISAVLSYNLKFFFSYIFLYLIGLL